MKKEREVILTFNQDGTIEKSVVGFEGKDCDVTKFIEEALGATDQKRQNKPEYLRSNSGPKNTIQASL